VKIAFLDPTAQAGGAERSLLEILAGLRAARPGWALHAIFGAEGPIVSSARALGAQAVVVPFPPALARLGEARLNGARNFGAGLSLAMRSVRAMPQIASYVLNLRRTLREITPDLVHGNGLKMDLLGAWAKPSATPMLWHIHDHLQSRPLMPHLMRLTSGACSAAITNSESVARDLRARCGDALKVFTVHNAVDLERFSPSGPRLDLDGLSGLPPVPDGTLRVGLVATMARWKGHEVFLRAMAMIGPDVPVRGYLIGGPIYQTDGSQYSLEELHSLCVRLGVSNRVGLTGFVEDSAAAVRSLDIVVHASTRPEPFGLVIAEAMACGKAVIISPAGGAAEIVSMGTDALSHSPGDPASLARAITTFAGDPSLRSRFGILARTTAERRFDRNRMIHELIAIYQAVTASAC
jgi:glycosyltransferase involved in cell wall biosynthesis